MLNPADFRLVMRTCELVKELAYRAEVGERLHLVLRLDYPGTEPDQVRRAIVTYSAVADTGQATR